MSDPAVGYSGNDFYCDVAIPHTVPLDIKYEDENVLAFRHTRPFWQVHYVVVPKKHIESFLTLTEEDTPILLEVLEVVRMVAAEVAHHCTAAKIITNVGAYQDSKHLHFHVVSGQQLR